MDCSLTLIESGKCFRRYNRPALESDGLELGDEIPGQLAKPVTHDPKIVGVSSELSEQAVSRRPADGEMVLGDGGLHYWLSLPNGSPGGGRSAGDGVGSS